MLNMHLNQWRRGALLLCVAAMAACATKSKPAGPKPDHAAVKPVPREDKWWVDRHNSMNAKAAKGGVDLIFIGDSITQGWEGAGKEVWEKHFTPRNPLNLGISGDRTQHVLWRIDNGNVNGIDPKAAVIMIGTNNSNDDSAQQIADGITAIVADLRAKLPKMKILLLAVFPREEKPGKLRAKLIEVNAIVKESTKGRNVTFLDIGGSFLQPDGSISKEIMPDFLHLSPKGYGLWADAIEPWLKQTLKD